MRFVSGGSEVLDTGGRDIENIVIFGLHYLQLTSNDDRAIEREFKKYVIGFFGYFIRPASGSCRSTCRPRR